MVELGLGDMGWEVDEMVRWWKGRAGVEKVLGWFFVEMGGEGGLEEVGRCRRDDVWDGREDFS